MDGCVRRMSVAFCWLCFVTLLLGVPKSLASDETTSSKLGRTPCSKTSNVESNVRKGTWNFDGTCSGYPEVECTFSF